MNIISLFNLILTTFVVSLALYHQHFKQMEPCAWCILQRIFFVLILIVSILGLKKSFKLINKISLISTFFISLMGIITAIYQIFWANSSNSCAMSLAEKFVNYSQLNTLFPKLFEIYALCADSNVNLLGLPYAFWSLIAFIIINVLTMKALISKNK